MDLHGIGDVFYNCEWHRLPIKQQKLFLYPIQRSQKAIRLRGFGIIDCSLSFFSSVKEHIFSVHLFFK